MSQSLISTIYNSITNTGEKNTNNNTNTTNIDINNNPTLPPKKEKCPRGERKDPKTGICVPMSDELREYKHQLRRNQRLLKIGKEPEPLPEIDPKIKRKYTLKAREPVVMKDTVPPKRKYTRRRKLVIQGGPIIHNDATEIAVEQEIPAPQLMHVNVDNKNENEIVEKPNKTRRKIQILPTPTLPENTHIEAKKTRRKVTILDKPFVFPPIDLSHPPSVIESGSPLEIKIDISPEKEDTTLDDIEDKIGKIPDYYDEKLYNSFLLKKEKLEYQSDIPTTDNYLYPTLDDPQFNVKIAERKEFQDNKYDGTVHDIRQQADKMCNAKFELLPHQKFIKNFLSFETPYNTLLLYHGLGSGKTCSSIGISEEMRNYMKQIGIHAKILIVASPNVQGNFRTQLFDEQRLELVDGMWNMESCLENSLLREINPIHLKGLSREKVIQQINLIINANYEFMGYNKLANYISGEISVNENSGYSVNERRIMEIQNIRRVFNNRLIIIDEVHNIRLTDDNKKKMIGILLMKIAKYADGLRLLLLSATPLYNSYKEVIWLARLMNANDKRGLIQFGDVFDENGEYRKAKGETGPEEDGRRLLARKLIGYVSYVRGENPYTFPYRIYPNVFAPENTFLQNMPYPSKQMNTKPITEPITHIPVYLNSIGEHQRKGYDFIIQYLFTKSTKVANAFGKMYNMPAFDEMDAFGYTLLQNPLEALNIVYPNTQFDEIVNNGTSISTEQSADMIKQLIGSDGLSRVMTWTSSNSPVPIRYNFQYREDILVKYGRIFHVENIQKYGYKIATICEKIRQSKGIVLVYSQYIDAGIVPLALALEEMGMTRYGSASHTRNLFKKAPTAPIDATTMKSREEMMASNNRIFKPAKYVMITGDKAFSPNNTEDMKYITNPGNLNGEMVKVILISRAGSEGLDFKNIRQVHILEPWYNMNRTEQIIGRAVRNKSHCELSFEQRNVEIYLHATLMRSGGVRSLSDEEKTEETYIEPESADLYIYRLAEKKAIQIGKVTRLMKEIAVDCHLNISQTNFTEEEMYKLAANQNIEIQLSSGLTVPYKIGDKPYTEVCDYMESCNFTCSPNATINSTETINYRESFLKENRHVIMEHIRKLFNKRVFYSRAELMAEIRRIKSTYPDEQIYDALTEFIENKTEYLVDQYGRSGYMVNHGEYYVFQPNELLDENATIYERTVPIDYKRTQLAIELPSVFKEQTQKNSLEREYNDKKHDSVYMEKMKPISSIDATKIDNHTTTEHDIPHQTVISTVEKNPEKILKKYNEILESIHENMRLLTETKRQDIKTGEKNWFKHAALVLPILVSVQKFTMENIIEYVIHHIMDVMPFHDKMIMMNILYSENVPFTTNIEQMLKNYFDERILEKNGKRGLLMVKDDRLKIWIQTKQSGSTEWVEAEEDMYRFFMDELKRFVIPRALFPQYVGFIHPFKGKEMVFKIKNLNQTRNNKGAKCENASKQEIMNVLNSIYSNTYYTKEVVEKDITTIGLCVILELTMRQMTEHHIFTDKYRWFFDPERTVLNKIVEL
jgi:hypothetical protein